MGWCRYTSSLGTGCVPGNRIDGIGRLWEIIQLSQELTTHPGAGVDTESTPARW